MRRRCGWKAWPARLPDQAREGNEGPSPAPRGTSPSARRSAPGRTARRRDSAAGPRSLNHRRRSRRPNRGRGGGLGRLSGDPARRAPGAWWAVLQAARAQPAVRQPRRHGPTVRRRPSADRAAAWPGRRDRQRRGGLERHLARRRERPSGCDPRWPGGALPARAAHSRHGRLRTAAAGAGLDPARFYDYRRRPDPRPRLSGGPGQPRADRRQRTAQPAGCLRVGARRRQGGGRGRGRAGAGTGTGEAGRHHRGRCAAHRV